SVIDHFNEDLRDGAGTLEKPEHRHVSAHGKAGHLDGSKRTKAKPPDYEERVSRRVLARWPAGDGDVDVRARLGDARADHRAVGYDQAVSEIYLRRRGRGMTGHADNEESAYQRKTKPHRSHLLSGYVR